MLLLTPNVLPLLLTGLNLQVQTYSELFSEAFRTHLVQVRFLSPFSYSVLLIKCIFYNSFRVIKQIGRGYLGKPCLWFLINTCVSMLPLFQLRNQVNVFKPIVCSDSLMFSLVFFRFVWGQHPERCAMFSSSVSLVSSWLRWFLRLSLPFTTLAV